MTTRSTGKRKGKRVRYIGHSVNSWCGRHGFVEGGGPCKECRVERRKEYKFHDHREAGERQRATDVSGGR